MAKNNERKHALAMKIGAGILAAIMVISALSVAIYYLVG